METATPSATLPEQANEVVVHIGYPKTGSTWLQRHVFPQLAGVRYGNEESLVRELVWNLRTAGDETFFAEATRAAFEQARSAGPLLVSDEAICGDMFEELAEGARNAERLARVAPGARILVLVRRQPEMMRSLYAQYVNMGGTGSLDELVRGSVEGSRFSLEHLEYDRLVNVYVDLFGRERVWVVPYEYLRETPRAFVQALCGLLGSGLTRELELSWLNRSLSPTSEALLRAWNRRFRETRFNSRPTVRALPGGRAVRNILQQRIDPAVRRLGRQSGAPEELGARFAESNARLQSLCDYPLADWGYALP